MNIFCYISRFKIDQLLFFCSFSQNKVINSWLKKLGYDGLSVWVKKKKEEKTNFTVLKHFSMEKNNNGAQTSRYSSHFTRKKLEMIVWNWQERICAMKKKWKSVIFKMIDFHIFVLSLLCLIIIWKTRSKSN